MHHTLIDASSPPPVPPKDSPYLRTKMESPPGTSASKRKRDKHDDDLHTDDTPAHTPKRTRSNVQRNDFSTSDEASTSGNPRSLRRKKKHNNLSNLNLRHAAERQRAAEQTLRESKFQEGSLTDKPSEKPPSAFTRIVRSDSGHLVQVDQLMEDYHDGLAGTAASVQKAVVREKHATPYQVDEIAAETARKDDGGIFKFGRSLASGFHPITLWNKLWNDTKDELTQRNYEEAMRRKQKEEAEARYAQMKQAGQFGLQPVGKTGVWAHELDQSPAADFGSARPQRDPSQLQLHSKEGQENDQPESAVKGTRTLRSRFSFRRPSMSNLKDGLFRAKSEFNLAAPAGFDREPPYSTSPVKDEFQIPSSSIRRTVSRFDLKKQNKLSKRVSDLESKLQRARLELDEALVQASPAPKIKNKYERFTPQSTVRRPPKFIPGALPSLPSERLLMTGDAFGDDEASPGALDFSSEMKPRRALDMSEAMELDEEEQDVETLKVSRPRPYPSRAESLFSFANRNIEHVPPVEGESSKTHQVVEQEAKPMPAMSQQQAGDLAPEAEPEAAAVRVKPAKKAGRTKKRKSGDDGDKAFKPGKDTMSDDEELVEQTAKKRKPASTKTNDSSPGRRTTRAKAAGTSSSPNSKKKQTSVAGAQRIESQQAAQPEDDDVPHSADEDDNGGDDTGLNGIETSPLPPVLEEEESATMTTTVKVPINTEPSRPTATATPSRYGRPATRSTSPYQRIGSVQPPSIEEQMLRGAAAAVQNRRVFSPLPANLQVHAEVDETVSLKPDEDGAPQLPTNVHDKHDSMDLESVQESAAKIVVSRGGEQLGKRREEYQWPDDVF